MTTGQVVMVALEAAVVSAVIGGVVPVLWGSKTERERFCHERVLKGISADNLALSREYLQFLTDNKLLVGCAWIGLESSPGDSKAAR